MVETTFDQPFVDVDLAGSARVRRRTCPMPTPFDTVTIDGDEYRVRTVGLPRGAAPGRPLARGDRTGAAQLCGCASLVAVADRRRGRRGVGLWIAGSVTAPLRRLTAAAEHVESTGQSRRTVGSAGDDEVGRLSAAFDRMLATLARSQAGSAATRAGRRPRAADPVHQPAHQPRCAAPAPGPSQPDREAVLADLHAETEELTGLVNEVVALAVGERRTSRTERST